MTNNSDNLNQNSNQILPLMPNFDNGNIPDDQIVQILTQIEKENADMTTVSVAKVTETNVTSKTFSYSNINCPPLMPAMYFPNSTVTVNYNFKQ